MFKAIIPCRSGSTRVKNKNLKKFADSSLLEIKIEQLKRISGLDEIIVNSNDEQALEVARNHGVSVVKRDDYFATNSISANDYYVNVAENCDSDYILFCTVTSPMLEDDSIKKMVDFYFTNKDKYKSVNSAHKVKEFLWLDGKPLNFEVEHTPRSQDLPNILAFDFACNVISKKDMLESRTVISKKPFLYEISDIEAVDVDWPIDFEFAEFLYKKIKMTRND